MDLRKQKTRQAIEGAFLQLRAERTLEQISVTELACLAKISKATFYLHYRDVYDLSETLQKAAIQRMLAQIEGADTALEHWPEFAGKMLAATERDNAVLRILFSDSQLSMFPLLLEDQLRECILKHSPELKEDTDLSIRLTYHIQGSYHTYIRHAHHADIQRILGIVEDIHRKTGVR